MFDPICKLLIEHFREDLASWLLGAPISLTQLDPSELSLEPIRADGLILLESDDLLLHIEMQTRPDPQIPFRMLDYRVRCHRRYPNKTVQQFVIYIARSRSPLVSQTQFSLEKTQHQFNVIRLWEQPTDFFFTRPGLLPFAVLSDSSNKTETLRQVAQAIGQISDRQTQIRINSSAIVLAGLVLEKASIEQILMRSIFEESVTYQSVIQEGVQQGTEVGRRQALTDVNLRLLQKTLGNLPKHISEKIQSLSVSKLEALSDVLLDFSSQDELSSWLSTAVDSTK